MSRQVVVSRWFLVLAYACFGYTLLIAVNMNRAYQDSWLLEGLWVSLLAGISLYVVLLVAELSLPAFVFLSMTMVFVFSSIGSLKYRSIYGSTIDNAVHLSLIKWISATGTLDPTSGYSETAAFHALVASIAQIADAPAAVIAKLMPAILNMLIPLTFYSLCTLASSGKRLTRTVVGLSTLSVWAGPTLLGTAFAIPLLLVLLTLATARYTAKSAQIELTLFALLFAVGLIFWHAITSFIAPCVISVVGIMMWYVGHRVNSTAQFSKLVSLGLLLLLGTITYWMYGSAFIWGRLGANLRLIFERDELRSAIPARIFQITLSDQAGIAMLVHARDATLTALATFGIVHLFVRRREWARRPLLLVWGMCWGVFLTIVLAVLVSGFGNQGYQRFLLYAVAFSPLPAGYFVHHMQIAAESRWKKPTAILVQFGAILGIFAIGLVQLYPLQPLVPSKRSSGPESTSDPVVWLHQVNTDYQNQMLEFANNQLPSSAQLLLDRFGYAQYYARFNAEGRKQERYVTDGKPGDSYILLHWPGAAGGFVEQLDYRSVGAISSVRGTTFVSTIYDNGQSFILYVPGTAEVAILKQWK